jgi:hypothetical protein
MKTIDPQRRIKKMFRLIREALDDRRLKRASRLTAKLTALLREEKNFTAR